MLKTTKTIIVLLILFLSAGLLSAETFLQPEFRPRMPEMMAQGTSYTAIAHGYGALFTNPAGFARKGGDFTLLSVTGALRAQPFILQQDLAAAGITTGNIAEKKIELIDIITAQLPDGIGAQAAVGFGIVGRGLGLGIISTVEADAQGKTLMGTSAPIYWTVAIPLGAAMTLPLSESMKITFGGDIRPMYRMSIFTTANDLTAMASGGNPGGILMQKEALTGTALAFDLGTIFSWNTLHFGLSLRDIFGTRFSYRADTLENIYNQTPDSTAVSDLYMIPMMARLGVAWKPAFDIFILSQPVIHGEYEIPFIPLAEGKPLQDPGSFFSHLNMGAEIKVFRFIGIQGGLTAGYLTGGISLDLLIFEINFAGYTEEYGPHAGDNPAAGMSLELAFRF